MTTMASHRTRILILVAASALLPALSVDAEAPQHVRTAHTFLMAWGNQRWDELRTVAAEQVTVRVGDKVFTLEPAAQKSEVALVFPFRGLSTIRADGKVNGITVEDLGLKVGDNEMRGPGTIMLKEQDGGEFRVIGVSTGAP
ncbi:MAG: hypothetical protein DMD88_12490 [Candidatus Rokuibacteriota bacterium]|nr:MAG: hypothetical protein DMD88_12490 [Candidatus Rokubacteria bacterium]